MANLYYIGAKQTNRKDAGWFVDEILSVFEVCPADTATARNARALNMADFEDALQVAAAQKAAVDAIVTRNTRDFRNSSIPALSPARFLQTTRNEPP